MLVPRQVERLGRESEVDAFHVEPLHDLQVDPIGVLQIIPVFGWVIPVNDDDIERVRIEFVEVNTGRKLRLVDRFVGMRLTLLPIRRFCGFRLDCLRYGQDFIQNFDSAPNLFRGRSY